MSGRGKKLGIAQIGKKLDDTLIFIFGQRLRTGRVLYFNRELIVDEFTSDLTRLARMGVQNNILEFSQKHLEHHAPLLIIYGRILGAGGEGKRI